MNIAFDIHGVLSDVQNIIPVVNELLAAGHDIYVISGTPVDEMKEELEQKYGYSLSIFKDFFSVIDHVRRTRPEVDITVNSYGWWIPSDEMWWTIKAEICEENNIDLLIDDSIEYMQGYLEDKFICYNLIENNDILDFIKIAIEEINR